MGTANGDFKIGATLCWLSSVTLPLGLLAIGGGPCAGPRNATGSAIFASCWCRRDCWASLWLCPRDSVVSVRWFRWESFRNHFAPVCRCRRTHWINLPFCRSAFPTRLHELKAQLLGDSECNRDFSPSFGCCLRVADNSGV